MATTKQIANGQVAHTEGNQKKVIEQLALNPEEMDALRRQGFITREARGGTVIFQLRFRIHGRQRVKYVGTDPVRGAALAAELEQLQRARQLDATLRKLNRTVSRILRDAKNRLEPLLVQSGRHFHGRMIRQWRKPASKNRDKSA